MNCFSVICFVSLGLSLGCGSEDPVGSDENTSGALLPWKTGNTWTFKVTSNDGIVTEKVTTVGPLEPVGGTGPHRDVMAHKVVTEKADGADETHSWQGVDGLKIVRYREQAFDMAGGVVELEEHWSPYKLRVDSSEARTKVGPTWVEAYDETKIVGGVMDGPYERRDLWLTASASETVVVPHGTFSNAVVLTRTGGSTKTYHFVRGVGKVKEVGGQMEELVAYTLMP